MDPFREFIDISDDENDDLMVEFDQDHSAIHEDHSTGRLTTAEPPNSLGSGSGRTLSDKYEICLKEILEVFPDISLDHVQTLYSQQAVSDTPLVPREIPMAQILIEKILDGGTYPKEKDRMRELKRKRSDKDIDEEETTKWKSTGLRKDPPEYAKIAKAALQESFEYVPVKFIQDTFKEHGHYYGAFFAILEAERNHAAGRGRPFTKLKARRVSPAQDSSTSIANLEKAGLDLDALKEEIESALQRKKREDAKLVIVDEAARVEEAKDLEHVLNGEVMDCGCCCETVTIAKLTHCNGEEPHFFCLECARRNANNDIGNSQYKLQCMDFSDCKATFSRDQRTRFLDEKTIEKLERLQQQEEIRLAGLENLSTCPFCDFSAICPSIEEDREFRCHNPHCEEVSCRLCKLKSHLPLSCAEHKKEEGVSERRIIEEARTEALIRTCSKCQVRILKEDGCNKVICTSCRAVLCDFCGKDISKTMYNHFDGAGGRVPPGLITEPGGKCPLYDTSNTRKERQVDEAENEAMAKVRAEHPELAEEDLKIKFAKAVQHAPGRHHHPMPFHVGLQPPGFPVPPAFGAFEARGGVQGQGGFGAIDLQQQQQQMLRRHAEYQAQLAAQRQQQQQLIHTQYQRQMELQNQLNTARQQANMRQARGREHRLEPGPLYEASDLLGDDMFLGNEIIDPNPLLRNDNPYIYDNDPPNPYVNGHNRPQRPGSSVNDNNHAHAAIPHLNNRRNQGAEIGERVRASVRGLNPKRKREMEIRVRDAERQVNMEAPAAAWPQAEGPTMQNGFAAVNQPWPQAGVANNPWT